MFTKYAKQYLKKTPIIGVKHKGIFLSNFDEQNKANIKARLFSKKIIKAAIKHQGLIYLCVCHIHLYVFEIPEQ